MKKDLLPPSEDYRLILAPNGDIRIVSCRTLEVVYKVLYEKGDVISDNMMVALLVWEKNNRDGSFIPNHANIK